VGDLLRVSPDRDPSAGSSQTLDKRKRLALFVGAARGSFPGIPDSDRTPRPGPCGRHFRDTGPGGKYCGRYAYGRSHEGTWNTPDLHTRHGFSPFPLRRAGRPPFVGTLTRKPKADSWIVFRQCRRPPWRRQAYNPQLLQRQDFRG
jgi:hypothetical protein